MRYIRNNLNEAIKEWVGSHNSGIIYWLRSLRSRLILVFLNIMGRLIKKKNKVLFVAFSGKIFGDNPWYILELIHQLSPNTELVWARKKGYEYLVPNYVRVLEYTNRRALYKEMLSSAILVDNNLYWAGLLQGKHCLMIETWHGGLGIKKIGNDIPGNTVKKRRTYVYDVFLSNSDFLSNIYRSAFDYNGLVWKCGYPIEDVLLQDYGEKTKVYQWYGLPLNKKIFLYAPTFRQDEEWSSDLDVPAIRDVLHKKFGGDWVVAVRWHPYRQQSGCKLEGAINMTGYPDMQELIKASDACLSDYSSSIFQAALWGIPCFIYTNDYDTYQTERDFYYTFDELPFPYAFSKNVLIQNISEYDKRYWTNRWEEFRVRMGHVVTGHAAQDVARMCIEFLNGKSKEEVLKKFVTQ